MCGIIGFARVSGPFERESLLQASALLQHRGPDAVGEWWSQDGRVGLGHRRLAIVDLSSAGSQPMLDQESGNVVAFNGEIYNHQEIRRQLESRGRRFLSSSDTEVILAAYAEWGSDCVERLNGMFAFAIYDSRLGKLFLARDRAGEKPLFIYKTGTELRFASELKALLADEGIPRVLDKSSFKRFLLDGFVGSGSCILVGFRKLKAAHAMLYDINTGECKEWQYWSLNSVVRCRGRRDLKDLVSEFEDILERAVSRQLIADVPVGLLLSGGVDSSLIASLATRHCSKLNTFTVSFRGHGSHDESSHAKLIADYFGTSHHEIDAQPATVDLLPLLASQYDEPLIDSSMLPTYLVTRYVREHSKVVLGGDGGDELFGGYPHYNRLAQLARIGNWTPRSIRTAMSWMAGALVPPGTRGRNWILGLDCDFGREIPSITGIFDRPTLLSLMVAPFDEEVPLFARAKGESLLDCAMRRDFTDYLTGDLLVKVDRASMLNSLEVRSPLLDVEVMEFAFGCVPLEYKVHKDRRKIVPKALAAKILPPEFDRVRKQGFSIPLSNWIQNGPWRSFFEDVLLDVNQTTFRHRDVMKMFRNESRLVTNTERLFGMVMFELWRNRYNINIT